ncbi:MAG: chalcone isomerase family protein [Paraglaciecola sp.]|uniref:chalcone isomerase family protein n=1 Tax=Paraglaciecola sp. TaxID=1920173 RepID=UPI0032968AFA
MTHLKYRISYNRHRVSFYHSLTFLILLYSPHALSNPLTNLTQVGEAKLTVFFWDIYNSSLYSQNGIYAADEFPQALKITYLRDISGKDLVKHTKEEWLKLGVPVEQIEEWLGALTALFPDINKGDTLLLIVNQEKTSEFFLNNTSIGEISDKKFGEHFLRIWLDENASYPKVRNKLLGKSDN